MTIAVWVTAMIPVSYLLLEMMPSISPMDSWENLMSVLKVSNLSYLSFVQIKTSQTDARNLSVYTHLRIKVFVQEIAGLLRTFYWGLKNVSRFCMDLAMVLVCSFHMCMCPKVVNS